LLTLLIGLAILLVVVSYSVETSDTLVVQALPAMLGISLLAALLDGIQVTMTSVADYQSMGDPATVDPGLAAEVIGSLLVATAAAAVSLRYVRTGSVRRAAREAARAASHSRWLATSMGDLELEPVRPGSTLVITAGAVGAVLGLVTAVWLDGAMGPDTSLARLAALALMGVLLGPALSVSLWRSATRGGP
jgi:hypothetical protein